MAIFQNANELGVSRNSRCRPFPRLKAPNFRSRIVGMDFLLFPFHSWICPFTDGNCNGNWNIVRDTRLPIFSSSSTFLTTIYIGEVNLAKYTPSLPVPEFWEWVFSIPFPFLNFGNGIVHSRSPSQIPKSHSRSPLWCIWGSFWCKRREGGLMGWDGWIIQLRLLRLLGCSANNWRGH